MMIRNSSCCKNILSRHLNKPILTTWHAFGRRPLSNAYSVEQNNRDLENLLQELKKSIEEKKEQTWELHTKNLTENKRLWGLKDGKSNVEEPVKEIDLNKKLISILDKVMPPTARRDIVREGILRLIENKFIENNAIVPNIVLNRNFKGFTADKNVVPAQDITKLDLIIFEDFLISLRESKNVKKNEVDNIPYFKEYINGKYLLEDKELYNKLTSNLYAILAKEVKTDAPFFNEIVKLYLNSLYEINRKHMVKVHNNNESLLKILSNPIHWYPETRLFRRKIVLHIGPTNSGKTFNALERLKTATGRSFYAGPLRLLAKEIYDRFNDNFKIPCNLTTGESIIEKIDPATGRVSNISSGTTELLAKQIQSGLEYDVVVLDEIQNIGLKQRGFAWCDILLGCKAKELHLCGEPRVVDIIKKICEITKDELIIRNYTRLSTLTMDSKPLESWSELKAGDCIIESSRKRIIDLKFKIEKETKHTVSVVYGGLPLEARLQQSYMFNSRASTILVASNAVGVGLNLNINRIIFNDIKRTDGDKIVLFDSSEIRQISGRAGRYNRDGHVSCIKQKDDVSGAINNFKHVQKILAEENPAIDTIYVFPPMIIISKLYDIFNEKYQYEMGIKFDNKFQRYVRFFNFLQNDLIAQNHASDSVFKFSVDEVINKKQLPKLNILCQQDNLNFYDILMLLNAPLKFQYKTEADFFARCVQGINDNKAMTVFSLGLPLNILKIFVDYPINDHKLYRDVLISDFGSKILGNSVRLELLEQLYRCLVLFCWLHNRYPNNFLDIQTVLKLQRRCELIIFYKLSVEPVYKMNTRVEIKNRQVQKQQARERLRQLNRKPETPIFA